jgi:hypothetical protein
MAKVFVDQLRSFEIIMSLSLISGNTGLEGRTRPKLHIRIYSRTTGKRKPREVAIPLINRKVTTDL